MPVVPFIPAIIGAGVGLYSASQARNSAQEGLQASNAATDKALASQDRAFNTVVGLNQKYVSAGYPAIDALMKEFGLDGGQSATSPGAPGANISNKSTGGYAGTSPINGGENGGVIGGQPGAQTGQPNYDWNAYVTAHPDIAAGYQAYKNGTTQGFAAPGTEGQSWQDWGYQPGLTLEQFAAQHYNTTGKTTGYDAPPQLPAPPPPPPSPSNPPTDLMTAQRPTAPAAPEYVKPTDMAAPTFGPTPQFKSYFDPNNFQTSPDYQFRLKQGVDTTNASAGARGMLRSGAALKAVTDYASNLASGEFGNAFNRGLSLYTTDLGQYNTGNLFQQGNYQYAQGRSDANTNNLNAANTSNYRFDVGRNDQNFNADRANQTNLYNTRVSNLFDLANLGRSAAGAVAGGAQTLANNQTSIFGSQANAAASAANSRAQANSYGAGAIGNLAGSIFSRLGGGGGASGDPYSDYSFYRGTY